MGLEERDGVGLDGLYDELVARQGLRFVGCYAGFLGSRLMLVYSRFARRAEADAPPAKPAKNSGNQATTGPSRAAKSKTRDLDLKAAREAVKAVNDQNGQPFLNHVFHLVS